jgi:hypothetical protein
MNITIELEAIAVAEKPLRDLETTLEAELREAESQRPTPTTHLRPHRTRETLRQLRVGVNPNEGIDARLWSVLNTPAMQRFRFRSPGLAPLARLKAKLLAEQEAANNPPPPVPLLKFRYTGAMWGKVAGKRHATGDIIQLTQEAASPYADKLELVVDEAELKVT